MLVPFDVVQRKNRTITRWQLRNSLIQSDAIDDRHRVGILGSLHDLDRNFALFGCLLEPHAALPKMHQHLVHGQPVQPGGERRLAAEASNLAKELNEYFRS